MLPETHSNWKSTKRPWNWYGPLYCRHFASSDAGLAAEMEATRLRTTLKKAQQAERAAAKAKAERRAKAEEEEAKAGEHSYGP